MGQVIYWRILQRLTSEVVAVVTLDALDSLGNIERLERMAKVLST